MKETQNFTYQTELQRMIEDYQKKPFHGKLPRPEWMITDELFQNLYYQNDRIFSEGRICYGWIVQANTILFKYFPQKDCPVQILYSMDPVINQNPELLQGLANEIYHYKNVPIDQVPQSIREIVAAAKNERDRTTFDCTCYLEDGTQIVVYCVTTMVYRKLIPGRKVIGALLPVIALRGAVGAVHVLPKQYWTKSFIEKCWKK